MPCSATPGDCQLTRRQIPECHIVPRRFNCILNESKINQIWLIL